MRLRLPDVDSGCSACTSSMAAPAWDSASPKGACAIALMAGRPLGSSLDAFLVIFRRPFWVLALVLLPPDVRTETLSCRRLRTAG